MTDFLTGEVRGLIQRRIKPETCQKFGYVVGQLGQTTVQIAPYYNSDGKLVAQKIRKPGKDFFVKGNLNQAQLFGQGLWPTKGRRVVVTEGEIDCLSYAQATNLSWPVVSVPNGASAAKKAVQQQVDWLEGYEEVVFLFDNDEPGRDAAAKCCEVLSIGKAKVATLPLKDPNEMLQAGRIKELVSAVWNAKDVRQDGLINGKELWDEVSKPVVMGTPYPWTGLNDSLFGIRDGEIVTLTAGTGIGKSAICAEIAYDLAINQGVTTGYIALEENAGRSGRRFMGINLNKPIHLPGSEVTEEQRRAAFDATLGTGRLWFYDHFGSLESDHLLKKLRHLVKGLGCRFLVLDHLTIVMSGMDIADDERRAIDQTMTRLRSFTEETHVSLLLVSHLRKASGDKGYEQGLEISLNALRGSHAISQLSDAVIAAERDQQAIGSRKNYTTLRVLKNRYSGITGPACALSYSTDTGRLAEVDPEVEEFGDGNDEF